MPNYDIIPLATDLLEYTIQRVRAKEPEYRRVRVYVMENGQLVEKQLYEKIKDDGKPHFPKSQTFHLCALMQNCATTILEKCISGDQCHYWAELVRPVKQKASNWRRTDSNRAAALREAKAAQDLAKMSQMALQIAEAVRHT